MGKVATGIEDVKLAPYKYLKKKKKKKKKNIHIKVVQFEVMPLNRQTKLKEGQQAAGIFKRFLRSHYLARLESVGHALFLVTRGQQDNTWMTYRVVLVAGK